jgi:hypothetical protein
MVQPNLSGAKSTPSFSDGLAVGQVMAVYSERIYRRHADNFESLWLVPYWEMGDRYRGVNEQLGAARPFSGVCNIQVVLQQAL